MKLNYRNMIKENGNGNGNGNGRVDRGVNIVESKIVQEINLSTLSDGSIVEYTTKSGVFNLVKIGTDEQRRVECFIDKDRIHVDQDKTILRVGNNFYYRVGDDKRGSNVSIVPIIQKIRLIKIQ